MRRFSMTMTAVAALALLCGGSMGWASGPGGGGSGGGSGGGGGGGGSTSPPPCYRMTVVATPNISLVPTGYYATPVQFVTSITNCGTVDDSPTIFWRFTPLNGCRLATPQLRTQILVPAGATVTVSVPWGVQAACDGDYMVTASAALKGGSTLVAVATDTFTFVNAMPGP